MFCDSGISEEPTTMRNMFVYYFFFSRKQLVYCSLGILGKTLNFANICKHSASQNWKKNPESWYVMLTASNRMLKEIRWYLQLYGIPSKSWDRWMSRDFKTGKNNHLTVKKRELYLWGVMFWGKGCFFLMCYLQNSLPLLLSSFSFPRAARSVASSVWVEIAELCNKT